MFTQLRRFPVAKGIIGGLAVFATGYIFYKNYKHQQAAIKEAKASLQEMKDHNARLAASRSFSQAARRGAEWTLRRESALAEEARKQAQKEAADAAERVAAESSRLASERAQRLEEYEWMEVIPPAKLREERTRLQAIAFDGLLSRANATPNLKPGFGLEFFPNPYSENEAFEGQCCYSTDRFKGLVSRLEKRGAKVSASGSAIPITAIELAAGVLSVKAKPFSFETPVDWDDDKAYTKVDPRYNEVWRKNCYFALVHKLGDKEKLFKDNLPFVSFDLRNKIQAEISFYSHANRYPNSILSLPYFSSERSLQIKKALSAIDYQRRQEIIKLEKEAANLEDRVVGFRVGSSSNPVRVSNSIRVEPLSSPILDRSTTIKSWDDHVADEQARKDALSTLIQKTRVRSQSPQTPQDNSLGLEGLIEAAKARKQELDASLSITQVNGDLIDLSPPKIHDGPKAKNEFRRSE